jgi:RNA polymerase sigma-70 factor (ECF subfamily)
VTSVRATDAAIDAEHAAVQAAVADAHRREWAFVLAATVRVTRDIDLAEECVQEAYAQALTAWRDAIPARPGAWLTTAARRRALDALRRQSTLARKLPLLIEPTECEPGPDDLDPEDTFPDDRLRLIFTCCHPALASNAQVALTLRLVCGLTTAEVAHAYLVTEPTMAARITRAKKKIAAARIPYRVPPPEDLAERTVAVLTVVHLLFTTGHTAPAGETLVRADLVERAIDVARMLHQLIPGDGAVTGLLALLLLTDSRRAARMDAAGRLVLLADQDRSRWDRAKIEEGQALAREALRRPRPGRFALEAAIAAVHAEAPEWERTRWDEIVALYDALLSRWPSPVVALNRAAAVSFASGPEQGLAELDALGMEPRLAGYAYLPAARADALRRLGRDEQARLAYSEAILLTDNAVEREFLERRIASLRPPAET